MQLSEAVEFAMRCARCWEDGSAYPWAVISMRDRAFMGVVELRVNGSAVDFGYIFAQRYWGRGIATEAVRAPVEWAWAQAEVLRVWATCHSDNAASARVLEKLGLMLEATREGAEPRPQLGEATGSSLVYARVRPTPAQS